MPFIPKEDDWQEKFNLLQFEYWELDKAFHLQKREIADLENKLMKLQASAAWTERMLMKNITGEAGKEDEDANV